MADIVPSPDSWRLSSFAAGPAMQPIDFNFSVPPFPAFPSVTRFVSTGSVREALQRICRSIDAREAISLVIGPPGTGKSLLCGLLAQQYRQSHDVVLLGETPIDSGEALQRHLLHHLGTDFESIAAGELQLEIKRRVCSSRAPAGGLLVVIDEAQALSAEVLEAIRMTTNIMHDGGPRVSVVLCGGVAFEENLVSAKLEALTQRVSARCYLHPLNVEETNHYIKETIRGCGADAEATITDEAISAVHHACAGVPRLINQIMTEAIDCAEECGQDLIDEAIIERAWAKLQQLPSPMVEQPTLLGDAAPVEFGELDETADPKYEPAPIAEPPQEETDIGPMHGIVDAATTSGESEQHPAGDLEIARGASLDSCFVESGQSPPAVSDNIHFADRDIAIADQQTQVADHAIEMSQDDFVWEMDPQASPESLSPATFPSGDCDPVPPAAPQEALCKEDLFGSFDDEETLKIGSIVDQSDCEPIALTTVKAFIDSSECGEEPELESVLHQEIIGLSAMVAGGLENAEPLSADSAVGGDAEVAIGDSEPQITVADIEFDDEQEDQRPAAVRLVNPAQESYHETTYHDDRDLLIIEDELELTRDNSIKRVDSSEKTISVDFQAMLRRMRAGV